MISLDQEEWIHMLIAPNAFFPERLDCFNEVFEKYKRVPGPSSFEILLNKIFPRFISWRSKLYIRENLEILWVNEAIG